MNPYYENVGYAVRKHSRKPFKSGQKYNTVTGIIDHPFLTDRRTGEAIPCYTFSDDESYVECAKCIPLSVTEQLDLFLQSPARNQWLLSPTIDVYVRKGVARDTVVGKVEPLELANINVRPKLQNTGVFTKVLCHVERLGYPVLIENILSKRFREFFIKRGYQPITKQNYGTVIKNFIG